VKGAAAAKPDKDKPIRPEKCKTHSDCPAGGENLARIIGGYGCELPLTYCGEGGCTGTATARSAGAGCTSARGSAPTAATVALT
jgi:hypothetical protein